MIGKSVSSPDTVCGSMVVHTLQIKLFAMEGYRNMKLPRQGDDRPSM